MIDRNWIRNNPELFDKSLATRGGAKLSEKIIELDQNWRQNQHKLELCLAERNKKSAMVAKIDKDKRQALVNEMKALKEKILELESDSAKALDELNQVLHAVPNIVTDKVPEGKDENDNKEIKKWGDIKKLSFKPKSHDELGFDQGTLDFATAANIAGSRFVVMFGGIARLERALTNFLLDNNRKAGYQECVVPVIVRDTALFGTGQLPKFADDLFSLSDNRYLIPTAEVVMTNFVADKKIPYEDLPKRYTTFSNCFRSEAGSAGRDTKGLIRHHQFSKVELVTITTPDQSDKELEKMLMTAEKILEDLQLPYRKVILCGGDIGFAARETYDLEIWFPAQKKYREVSSCSNCGDFQAIRMNAKYDLQDKSGSGWLHTLNGSALPLGRLIAAIMENYQQEDGSVTVPEALVEYCGFSLIKNNGDVA